MTKAKCREISERIARWRAAYALANGKPAPAVQYASGWYYLADTGKWRASRIEDATARLIARAAECPP